MSSIGQIEKRTQQRVLRLFREQLGYDSLGDWTEREDTCRAGGIIGRC